MVQEKNRQFLELQLLLQKEHDTTQYFHSLYAQDEKQKILIHDIRRHLLTISNLARNKEYDKITAYIDQIVQSSDLQESVRFCDNKLLNAILYRAKQQARSSDTTLITDIRSGCADLLSSMILLRCLAIFWIMRWRQRRTFPAPPLNLISGIIMQI